MMPEPGGSDEPQTFLEMWSRGLDAMIMAATIMGCKAFKDQPIANRVSINITGLREAGFGIDDLQGVLAVAMDRLSGLALEGATVYGTYGDGQ